MQSFKEVARIYVGVVIPVSVLFPLIPALVKYRQLPLHLKILGWYLGISAVTSVFGTFLGFNNWNNMPLLHLYTFVEFWVLYAYYQSISRETGRQWYMKALVPGFFVLCLANATVGQGIFTYNTYTKSLEAVLMIALCVRYFKRVLDEPGSALASSRYLSFINSGFLVYFSGSLVLFSIFNFIVNQVQLVRAMMSVHATLLFVVYILIGVALWKQKA